MIQPGKYLPADFEVEFVHSGEVARAKFGELLARPAVVSIYMKNNTGSCDKQNDALVAGAAEIERRGFRLIAISRDTCGSHVKYAAKKGIGYTLVSDPEDVFAKAADAIVEKSMYGKTYEGPARSAFVLGAGGKVLAVIEKVDTKDHAKQVLAVLDGL